MAKHHSSTDSTRLPNFSQSFQPKYLIGKRKTRSRRFTPKLLFHTVLELVAGTNKQGFTSALLKSFDFRGKSGNDLPPHKGSLSKMRARISFKFFRSYFLKLITSFEPDRLTFQGFRVYATDGFELSLPRSKSILKAHFAGRALSDNREMYYPRMYLTHCYDVLSGVTKDFKQHHLLDEITDAEEMIPSLEKNSICLYDRLFMSKRIVSAHNKAGNYFIARCKKGSFSEIENFFKSSRSRASAVIEGVTVHLLKFTPPGSTEAMVYATNLPRSWLKIDLISSLYNLRWEVEVSFKDLLETMKIEQWHSKSLNGILQELYAAFWLMNYTKIQMIKSNEKPLKVLDSEYSKPNFKVLFEFITDLLPSLFKRLKGLFRKFKELLNFCTETRERHSRHYKRELKTSASPYEYNNTVWVH